MPRLTREFTKDQIEHIRECVLFHYDMNSDIKEHIMDINAQCLKKLRGCDSGNSVHFRLQFAIFYVIIVL